jgi:two-component system, cell cycle sensor histidine kinase and response regulator CckA
MHVKLLSFIAISVAMAVLGQLACGWTGVALGFGGTLAGCILATVLAGRGGAARDAPAIDAVLGAVQAENRRLDDFLDTAPVGFFSVDAEGRFQLINDTLANWLGYAPEELTGGTVGFTMLLAHPEDAGRVLPPRPAAGVEHVELVLKRRDGSELPTRISQAISPDGAQTRSVVHDLTQERAIQQALRRADQRFHRFFDAAPIGIVIVDKDGLVRELNTAFGAMLGAAAESFNGRPVTELFEPADRAELQSRLAGVIGGATDRLPVEARLTVGPTRRGEQRVALVYASRLAADEATHADAGAVIQLIDTTEQKNLELQFAQSQKMQAVGQLAGGIAHDFNNLLTAIIGYCDLLLLRYRAGDPSFADVMQVKQNANRAANLVRQLLAFSRQQTLRPKVLVLSDVLAELSNLLRRLLGESIQLKVVHGRDLGLVKVDQGQLEQVIINLAVNARDAMRDTPSGGGTLTVRTSNFTAGVDDLSPSLITPGDYVLVEITDTGKGIPKELIGKIFDPFFTTKEVGHGTGLGLSTVYGIIKQTGGFIFPYSEVGKGTTFRLYLPRHKAAAGTEEEAGEAADTAKPQDLTGKGTILLVEDEDAVRVFAARALRNKGYTVLEAPGGQAALDQMETHGGKIDVLISDVVMPNMDGPTLVKHVRGARPDIKIIFISGYAEDAFRKTLDHNADINFLPKPFSLKQLAGIVKQVMTGEAA